MIIKLKLSLVSSIVSVIFLFALQSCSNAHSNSDNNAFEYKRFKDSIVSREADTLADEKNFFDSTRYIPGLDSINEVLIKMDSAWHKEFMELKARDTAIWHGTFHINDSLFSLKENINTLDSFLAARLNNKNESCNRRGCYLYIEIIKSAQTLYLYLDGKLTDSFLVSTGKGKYETPLLDVRPSGPLLRKYTSRKFPGGNYEGLGNMPYAVFVRGGYAIHGTTTGNFSKLGSRASHGCIRLHPLNAKIFFELVKLIGLNNTWVSIKDSLPVINNNVPGI